MSKPIEVHLNISRDDFAKMLADLCRVLKQVHDQLANQLPTEKGGACCEHADINGKNCPVHREDKPAIEWGDADLAITKLPLEHQRIFGCTCGQPGMCAIHDFGAECLGIMNMVTGEIKLADGSIASAHAQVASRPLEWIRTPTGYVSRDGPRFRLVGERVGEELDAPILFVAWDHGHMHSEPCDLATAKAWCEEAAGIER